jgi:hypothetical protein
LATQLKEIETGLLDLLAARPAAENYATVSNPLEKNQNQSQSQSQ